MGWPQYVLLLWAGAELGLTIARHGRFKRPPHHVYNAWSQGVAWALLLGLLTAGGFFG